MNWKLTLEYDGSKYRGWQEQKNARGVQGELRHAAEEVMGQAVDLQGAGRTDAGVHADGQVAHLRCPRPGAMPGLAEALNERLPADLVVLSAEPVAWEFHARHDALSRTYRYQISPRKSAFAKKYIWWIKRPLNLDAMNAAASLLPGRHDFRLFRAEDPARPDESTIVVVHRAGFTVASDGLILFHIAASHFLWRMVRRVVGALVQIGLGELSQDNFERLLEADPGAHFPVAEWTAPASGLFLESVQYPASGSVTARPRSVFKARAPRPAGHVGPRGGGAGRRS